MIELSPGDIITNLLDGPEMVVVCAHLDYVECEIEIDGKIERREYHYDDIKKPRYD